tara:strand:- start:520 stop:666 length:147 start_codon:yes stop_codon:yes gene_type:complete
MASQGGGGGISKTDILKLLYGDASGGASPTTDGIGLVLHDAFANTEVT